MRLLGANVVEVRVLLKEAGNEGEGKRGSGEQSDCAGGKPVPPLGASEVRQIGFILGCAKSAGAFQG